MIKSIPPWTNPVAGSIFGLWSCARTEPEQELGPFTAKIPAIAATEGVIPFYRLSLRLF